MHGLTTSKREKARKAQARYRANLAAGVRVAPVRFGPLLLDYLVKLHWLDAADADDARRVGAAIEAGLAEMAEAEER